MLVSEKVICIYHLPQIGCIVETLFELFTHDRTISFWRISWCHYCRNVSKLFNEIYKLHWQSFTATTLLRYSRLALQKHGKAIYWTNRFMSDHIINSLSNMVELWLVLTFYYICAKMYVDGDDCRESFFHLSVCYHLQGLEHIYTYRLQTIRVKQHFQCWICILYLQWARFWSACIPCEKIYFKRYCRLFLLSGASVSKTKREQDFNFFWCLNCNPVFVVIYTNPR